MWLVCHQRLRDRAVLALPEYRRQTLPQSRTIEQVELVTLECVWRWNNQCLHGELNMRTPIEVEAAYYADLESPNPAPAGQSSR